jgi:hypothetical protein
MFGEFLRKSLGLNQEAAQPEMGQDGQGLQQQQPAQSQYMQMPMPFGQKFSMTPQGPDVYGQYNNPLMFLRRF